MATGIYSWSQTAGSNNSADSTINWAEGQAPSTVNDSSRAVMAVLAKWRDDMSGVKTSNTIMTTAGSANAQTLSTNGSIAALTNGWTVTFKVGADLYNTSACTLAVDGLTAKNIQCVSGSSLLGGELIAGSVYTVTYHQPADAWVLHGGTFPAEALLISGTISSASESAHVLTSYAGFRAIRFVLTSLVPTANDDSMYCQISADGGSTYKSGSSDYKYARTELASLTGTQTDEVSDGFTACKLIRGVGTSYSANLDLTLYNQTSTSVRKTWSYTSSAFRSNASLDSGRGSGSYNTASDAINAIKFYFSSGNIASGKYALYGLR